MKLLLLLPLLLGFTSPPIVISETITINQCWKYKSNGKTLKYSTETCDYYSTGYQSADDAVLIKDEAYANCTERAGAFNYTESVKTSLKKGTTIKYKYFCQTNS